ncbi:MAG: hypothetical protein Q8P00_02255 [Dehalococcoidia bacterium]|nr:hypothetical protein [Dehalococcoidia bacterium]
MSFLRRSFQYFIAIVTLVAGMLLFFVGGVWYFMTVFYQNSWGLALVSFLLGLGLIILSYVLKPRKLN